MTRAVSSAGVPRALVAEQIAWWRTQGWPPRRVLTQAFALTPDPGEAITWAAVAVVAQLQYRVHAAPAARRVSARARMIARETRPLAVPWAA